MVLSNFLFFCPLLSVSFFLLFFASKAGSSALVPVSVQIMRSEGPTPPPRRLPQCPDCRAYFHLSPSSENLSKDLYLMSQMDSDQFVPIWTIASMEGIKALTTDMDLILDVLRCKELGC